MTLEQAIIILEDGAARTEMANSWMPGKNKVARIRQNEGQRVRRDMIEQLKKLAAKEEDFAEIDARRAKYGGWFKLKEKSIG